MRGCDLKSTPLRGSV